MIQILTQTVTTNPLFCRLVFLLHAERNSEAKCYLDNINAKNHFKSLSQFKLTSSVHTHFLSRESRNVSVLCLSVLIVRQIHLPLTVYQCMVCNVVPFKTLLFRSVDVWQAKETKKFHLSKLGQNTEVILFSNCSVIDWLLFKIKGLEKENIDRESGTFSILLVSTFHCLFNKKWWDESVHSMGLPFLSIQRKSLSYSVLNCSFELIESFRQF